MFSEFWQRNLYIADKKNPPFASIQSCKDGILSWAMDERVLNELLECSVCLDRLDHTSKVLPCQHTFCRRCLEEIVSTKSELRCPECRSLVEPKVEDLPTNILLVRLLEGIKTAAVRSGINTASGSSSRGNSCNTSPSHVAVAGTSATGVRGSPSHAAKVSGAWFP